jgi:predicted GNAT family acetyltransferase
MSGPVIEVKDERSERAYIVYVDGAPAGRAEYLMRDGRVVFVHTEIDDEHKGLGLARKLVRYALDDVRSKGELLVPICPFVSAYIQRHPEYDDLVDHDLSMQFKRRRGTSDVD